MTRTTGLLLAALLATAAIAPAGCGNKAGGGDSAQATAGTLAAALDAGKFDQAAALFDYTDYARKQFEDWDSLPSSQRELIIKKTAEEKAGELQALKQRLGTGIKLGQVQGDTATIAGNAGSATIQMAPRDGEWLITNTW